ncbi:MAG: hypothetical protein IID14_07120 [Candidatus Marinimicrobia bacterium]|nr:hypothetical protein [Candidatus Neomarinimicrobiota bacterium]
MTRVLVIRFSSMGDIILTAPVINALRQTYPDLTLDYLVHEQFQTLVSHFDPPPERVIPFPAAMKATRLPAYARELAQADYDLVLDLHDSLRSKLLRRFFPEAQRRVYRKPRLKRWLLFNLWINRFPPDFSVVNEYLRYAGLDLPAKERQPRMSLGADESMEVLRRYGLEPGYLACVPGAAWPQKSWLKERYIELFGQRLASHLGRVVLLGGPHDTICDEIARSLDGTKVTNLKGKTRLAEALALLSRSHGVVGSDTGLVHAAEALGVPVVMILGPTSRETGAHTHNPASQVHEVPLWCRPCSQNGRRSCYRQEQYCLTGTTVDQVGVSIDRIMGWA